MVELPINHIDDVCLTIAIEEDNIFEDTEFFEVTWTGTGVQICSTNNRALVGITDTTRKYMGHHIHTAERPRCT